MSDPSGRTRGLEEQLAKCRHEHDTLRRVLQEMPDTVLVTDDTGAFHFICENVKEIFGYTQAEVQALGTLDALLKANPIDQAALEKAGTLKNLEIQAPDKSGSERVLLVNAKRCRLYGGTVLVVIRDITDRRVMERELAEKERTLRQTQRLEAVGRLAGGVAHDFNNLLTAVFSYSEFLGEELGGNPAAKQDLQQIIAAAERGATLVRQLLTFASHKSGASRILDPAEILAGTELLLQRLLGDDLEVVVEGAEPPWPVCIPPGAIEQVLVNLGINARDAMPDGGRLTFSSRNATVDRSKTTLGGVLNAGEYVVIEVRDTGHGMDEETRQRVLDPFFSTKDPGRGTGLGLSTSYGLLASAGGAIDVDSAPGRGTSVTIYVPRAPPGDPKRDPSAEDEATLAPATIVVVEDDPAILQVVSRALQQSGHNVLTAPDGQAALRVLEAVAVAPDLLITDVTMPALSGLELVRQAGARWPRMRVLFMSGYNEDARLLAAAGEGDVPFLGKPFSPDELRRKVRSILADDTHDAGRIAERLSPPEET